MYLDFGILILPRIYRFEKSRGHSSRHPPEFWLLEYTMVDHSQDISKLSEHIGTVL